MLFLPAQMTDAEPEKLEAILSYSYTEIKGPWKSRSVATRSSSLNN
jgi:hypothetical protein